jgi:hypothetical protein
MEQIGLYAYFSLHYAYSLFFILAYVFALLSYLLYS